ncbi:MAG: hypothetical protein ACE5GN_07060 [Waddliaceae bacterium]
MKWYKVTLTNAQIANNQGQKLNNEFQEIYSEEGEPEDMALFSRNDGTEGRTYYFSPGAVKYALIVLSFYSGLKCDAPLFEDVDLELGASDAKDRLPSRN